MNSITLLDGGFSTELGNQGFNINEDPLWGAGYVKTNPEAVVQVHSSYIKAGSDVITTASYQASVDGFVKHLGVSTEGALELMAKSVTLAQQAIALSKESRPIIVAGSIGPYGASLNDGSEYHGNYVDLPSCSDQILQDWHRARMGALVSAGVQVLALETQPALKEVLALLRLLREFPNVKAWLSFCCTSPANIAHGESLKEALQQCLQVSSSVDQLQAVGVNCCAPQHVTSLLAQTKEVFAAIGRPALPLVAYPNSGEEFIPRVGWKKTAETRDLNSYCQEWFQAGATWLGGCCRTSPRDISLMKKTLSAFMS